MEEFLGKELSPNEVVHHINGDTRDNMLENLEVLSRKEHSRKHRTGTKCTEITKEKIRNYNILHGYKGSQCKKAKLTADQIREIKQLIIEGVMTQSEISRLYGISRPKISRIKSGKSYVFEYKNS